jgi:hypothetical protein
MDGVPAAGIVVVTVVVRITLTLTLTLTASIYPLTGTIGVPFAQLRWALVMIARSMRNITLLWRLWVVMAIAGRVAVHKTISVEQSLVPKTSLVMSFPRSFFAITLKVMITRRVDHVVLP